jgi:hypothetical protein
VADETISHQGSRPYTGADWRELLVFAGEPTLASGVLTWLGRTGAGMVKINFLK